jgi:hypothetical protein
MGRVSDARGNANKNGAVTNAVLVHQRVEPPHFDWRSRERPALALLAWEAACDPKARLCFIQLESIGTMIIFGPTAMTNRYVAAPGLMAGAKADNEDAAEVSCPGNRRHTFGSGKSFNLGGLAHVAVQQGDAIPRLTFRRLQPDRILPDDGNDCFLPPKFNDLARSVAAICDSARLAGARPIELERFWLNQTVRIPSGQ